jgi:hypothetical protein
LKADGSRFIGGAEKPSGGYLAAFGEIVFRHDRTPYMLSTQVRIVRGDRPPYLKFA